MVLGVWDSKTSFQGSKTSIECLSHILEQVDLMNPQVDLIYKYIPSRNHTDSMELVGPWSTGDEMVAGPLKIMRGSTKLLVIMFEILKSCWKCIFGSIKHKKFLQCQQMICSDLLPSGNMPLPWPMLTYHQWGLVAFTWGYFHEKYSWTIMRSYPEPCEPLEWTTF